MWKAKLRKMASDKTKQALIILVLSILSYWPSLQADFAFDDRPAVLENKDVTNEDFQNISYYKQVFHHDFWGSNITDHSNSHKSYRPLTVLSFAFDTFISRHYFQTEKVEKISPIPFHLHNVILHAINAVLFYAYICKILTPFTASQNQNTDISVGHGATYSSIAFVSAALFSIHPIHSESVVGVVGRADLLYSLFVLLALLIRRVKPNAWIIPVLLSILSLLSKEQGIILLPMIIIHDVLLTLSKRDKRRPTRFLEYCVNELPWKSVLTYVPLLFTMLYVRLWVMDFRPPKFKEGDNPTAFLSSLYLRQINFSYIYALNFWLLLAPAQLCFDWSMACLECICCDRSLPSQMEFQTIKKILLIISFWIVITGILIRAVIEIFGSAPKKVSEILLENTKGPSLSPMLGLAITLLLLPFLPAANIFFTVGFVIAERNLYLSVAGFSLLIAIGHNKLSHFLVSSRVTSTESKHRKRQRQKDTNKAKINGCILFMIIIFICKNVQRSCEWKDEETLYRSGLRVCPKNAKIYYNIAKLLQSDSTNIKKYQKIKRDDIEKIWTFSLVDWKEFENELRPIPMKTDYYFKDTNTLVVLLYKTAIRLWPRYEHALNNLANVLRKRKEKTFHLEANDLLLKALEVSPNFSAAWMNLGIVQAQLGKLNVSEESYFRALSLRSDVYPDGHFNLGTLYLKFKDKEEEALYEFNMAISQDEKHFSAWSNKVILLDELDRLEEAKVAAERANLIFPENADFYFHLGNILGKQSNFEKAEKHYHKAIHILDQSPLSKSSKTQSLYRSNLGVLYHRWKKAPAAIKNYEDALLHDPHNLNAKQNLKILWKLHKT